jgi:hypothetical protein
MSRSTTFDRNTALSQNSGPNYGGAAYFTGNAEARFCECTTWAHNRANSAGALYTQGSVRVRFSGGHYFYNNTAVYTPPGGSGRNPNDQSGNGGAIWVSPQSGNVNAGPSFVFDSTSTTCFVENKAEQLGGAVYIASGRSNKMTVER